MGRVTANSVKSTVCAMDTAFSVGTIHTVRNMLVVWCTNQVAGCSVFCIYSVRSGHSVHLVQWVFTKYTACAKHTVGAGCTDCDGGTVGEMCSDAAHISDTMYSAFMCYSMLSE